MNERDSLLSALRETADALETALSLDPDMPSAADDAEACETALAAARKILRATQEEGAQMGAQMRVHYLTREMAIPPCGRALTDELLTTAVITAVTCARCEEVITGRHPSVVAPVPSDAGQGKGGGR